MCVYIYSYYIKRIYREIKEVSPTPHKYNF